MQFPMPGCLKTDRLMKNCLKWSAWRQIRSATTEFIVDNYFVLQETARVLSAASRVAS